MHKNREGVGSKNRPLHGADLWGALKKIPKRLLEALRYYLLPDADFDAQAANRCHISLNTSDRWLQACPGSSR
jgi:hypothetical protein